MALVSISARALSQLPGHRLNLRVDARCGITALGGAKPIISCRTAQIIEAATLPHPFTLIEIAIK